MLDFDKLKAGDIVSESPYSIVEEVKEHSVLLKDTSGHKTEVGKTYIETIHFSADQFIKIEAINRTEMIKKFLSNPRIACSVYFKTKDTPKTKRKLDVEKQTRLQHALDVTKLDLKQGLKAIVDLVENPILDFIPGEMRLMKGFHEGEVNERGRIRFIDMEDGNTKKVVDPRTLEEYIVYNTKFIIKK